MLSSPLVVWHWQSFSTTSHEKNLLVYPNQQEAHHISSTALSISFCSRGLFLYDRLAGQVRQGFLFQEPEEAHQTYMRLQQASYEAIKYACTHFHYSKSVPANPLGYSVFRGEVVKKEAFCGVVVFGIGANRSIASPYGLHQGQVIELTRVALNGKQESTSQAISIALRLIKRDIPLAKLVISYADTDQGHAGIVYQATNWIYEGLFQAGNVWGYEVKGKRVHKRSMAHEFEKKNLNQGFKEVQQYFDNDAKEIRTLGKHKYLYPLTPEMVRLCKLRRKPYPKKMPTTPI